MELKLYNAADAEEVVSWVKTEKEYAMWTRGRFGTFPPSAKGMNGYYSQKENILIYSAFIDDALAGHITISETAEEGVYMLGFIIINPLFRGTGMGKELVYSAISLAKKELCAKKLTLNVFSDNIFAKKCYKSLGFMPTGHKENLTVFEKPYSREEMELKL